MNEGKIPLQYNQAKKPKVIYVFQGGGAIGAYQVGAYKALREHGYAPDMLVGISIGAINAAIIAGNPADQRLDKLSQFWDKITTKMPFSSNIMPNFSKTHHFISAQLSLLFGQPGFFSPKLMNPFLKDKLQPYEMGIYDTSPLRQTLLELIDFKYLNEQHVRLCVGSVNLESGEFVFFDNYKEELTVEHIMASAALPPGFPPIKIKDQYYVDGGVYSNTPISKVIDDFAESEEGIKNILCFMVDLFAMKNILPHSMDGLLERIKDIRFSSHATRNNKLYATTQNLSHAIHYLAKQLTPAQRKDHKIKEIIKLGFANKLKIVHLIYKSPKGTELESKDYEFSLESANLHSRIGYENTAKIIEAEEPHWIKNQRSGVKVYNQEEEVITETKMAATKPDL